MKKLLTLLLSVILVLPLFSQESQKKAGDFTLTNYHIFSKSYEDTPEPKSEEGEASQKTEKKDFGFARRYFEIGIDAGAGLTNGLAPLSDILTKNVVLDLAKIALDVPNEGGGLNVGLSAAFFVNVKNITIGTGLWDFGFIVDADGGVNMNLPKSLFTLIAEGNANQHDSRGTISGSGGIFTEIGLKGSAKYQVAGKTLYAGIKPAIYTPAVYISPNPGISYHLYTEKDGKEGLFLDTEGEINIYTPTSFENIEPGRFIIGPSGFDLSLEGEYALFPFLDVGGSLANIPFAAAALTNQMRLRLVDKDSPDKGFNFELAGTDFKAPDLDFAPEYYDNVEKNVFRPFRFDVYARYKPFNSELLVIRPNLGFSVNVNEGDEQGFFNAGLEARLNLKDMFMLYIGSGYKEEIWRQKAGLVLNLRAFELDFEAALRDLTFAGCFEGRCFDMNVGLRFGW